MWKIPVTQSLDVIDRFSLGPPSIRMAVGRHVLDSRKPVQLSGAIGARMCKAGQTGVPMVDIPCFVGIDVAKAQLDIAQRPSGERWTVPNDADGVGTLWNCGRPSTPP